MAEALQRVSFSTGSVQNGQYRSGFTQGAKVTSFFGLDPSYTRKTTTAQRLAHRQLSGALQRHRIVRQHLGHPHGAGRSLDILPGAQSSIYGSDAIAGVVNIVMKQNIDGPFIDARYGFTTTAAARTGASPSPTASRRRLQRGRRRAIRGFQSHLGLSTIAHQPAVRPGRHPQPRSGTIWSTA